MDWQAKYRPTSATQSGNEIVPTLSGNKGLGAANRCLSTLQPDLSPSWLGVTFS